MDKIEGEDLMGAPSAPYTADTIAEWFLTWARYEDEAVVSNLKLQKLLYYAQGHYLARHSGTPLFSDPIQAWAHGPVVPDVYHRFKPFGSDPIEVSGDFDFAAVDDDAASWLVAIWNSMGSRTAWKLREMTHSEPPWKDTYERGVSNVEIPLPAMYRYFSSLYIGARAV